jgi:hypothetical protein
MEEAGPSFDVECPKCGHNFTTVLVRLPEWSNNPDEAILIRKSRSKFKSMIYCEKPECKQMIYLEIPPDLS